MISLNMYGGSGKDARTGWVKVESLQFVKNAMATQIVTIQYKFRKGYIVRAPR